MDPVLVGTIQLRQWQVGALEAWERSHTGIVRVVTGGGKTVFALACLTRWFAERRGRRCIIVVPTIALMDQWVLELLTLTSASRQDIALHGGGWSESDDAQIHVCTLNTARSAAPRLAAGNETLLIVDECHRAASPMNRRAIDIAASGTLGLSATPERQGDDFFETELMPVLGEVIYRYDYRQALEEGVLSPFILRNVKVEPNPSAVVLARERLPSVTGPQDPVLEDSRVERALLMKRRNAVACELVSQHSNERSLVFHERIKEALEIQSLLGDRGITAAAYHSKQGPHLRGSTLLEFRKGVRKVLVTCRALDEGLNVPEASVGVIVGWTKSVRQRIQRLGRVLRPAPGKQSATVYTLFTNDEEQELLEAEAKQLDGVAGIEWLRVGDP